MKKTCLRILIAIIALIVILSPFLIEPILYSWSVTRDMLLVSKSKAYKRFSSPDGHFLLEFYYCPENMHTLISEFLSTSGDDPGIAILRDKNGDILKSCKVRSIDIIEHAEWTSNSVYVKFALDWRLPPKKSSGQTTAEKP